MNWYAEALNVLVDRETSDYITEATNVQYILEDANSPITRKLQEKLYKSVINKAHIDFDDIPKSAGNIRNYSGYNSMMETLRVIEELANEEKANNVKGYVDIVKKAINNIANLSATYEKGFLMKADYVALEYDTYVYFCVEATTALIYSFIDIVKSPDKNMYEMKIKNTKLRAEEFYFDKLSKFNSVQDKQGIDYRKMLEKLCEKDKANFTGATIVGIAAISAVALAIIPVTREIIYQIYNFRGKLANNLELQSHFLELNKHCLENNDVMDIVKKNKIIKKQEELAKKLEKASNDIKVKSAKSIADSKDSIKKDNKEISVDGLRDEISNEPLVLF